MTTLPCYWRVLLPYLRHELPAWGRVYAAAGGTNEQRWRDAGSAIVRGKLHGYTMRLDLSNWSERLTWCLGRYHDLPLQLALRQMLRPGDAFVDIGANLGMLSLLAHRLVGDRGRVMACEPNPRLQERIGETVRDNALAHLEVVGAAIGEGAATAELREFAGHSGWGSLSPRGPEGFPATATWTVPIVRGDDVLARIDPAMPLVLKIDVEGHEVPVLRGIQQTLRTRWPLLFVEVAEAHQRRAGHSAAELRGLLEVLGYRGLVLDLRRKNLFGHALALRPLAAEERAEVDVAFVPPQGPLAERLSPLLAKA